LLVRVHDAGDAGAWSQLIDIFAPVLWGYCVKRGLTDADAASVTEEALAKVSRSIRRSDADPSRYTLRAWLFAVLRHGLRKWAKRQGVSGRLFMEDRPEDIALWKEEYRRGLFRWTARQVEAGLAPADWQAFWQTTVGQSPVDEVAINLGLSADAVLAARSRVLARLSDLVRDIEGGAEAHTPSGQAKGDSTPSDSAS
jgi:RNA polymerase sigma-70 factor (ECF subfamily)